MKLKLTPSLDNNVNLELESPQGSLCAVDVSNDAHRYQLTKRRILHLIENFDVNQKLLIKDRCELQRLANQRERLNQASPVSGQTLYDYREVALNPFRPRTIDYQDAWDAFNDAGLTVSSNVELDNSPCEWDEFPQGVPREVLAGIDAARPYLWKQLRRSDNDIKLAKLEKSILQDLIYWNSHVTSNNRFNKKIEHNEKSRGQKVYGNAFCFNSETGLHTASAELEPEQRAYSIQALHPERSVHGETFPVKVYVKKQGNECLPVS